MPTRTKNNTSFINWMNKKYRKELGLAPTAVKFYYYDDYAIWMYFEKYKMNDQQYYEALEEDIKEYCDFQTGKEIDTDEHTC